MDAPHPASRSPSRADLQRQPSGLVSSIQTFQRTRSRSVLERMPTTPKFIVPVRAAHSAHGSNSSSSRRGRNSSQSRKAHPSESRYSNRSFRDKSSRRHDVEIEDLNVEAPPPVLPRQDSSVYPSAMLRHASSPTPINVPEPVTATQLALRASEPPRAVIAPSQTKASGPSRLQRVESVSKALLRAALVVFYVLSATPHNVFPEYKHLVTLRRQLLHGAAAADTLAASTPDVLHVVSCVVFASVHTGSLVKTLVAAARLSKRIRVAPVPILGLGAPTPSTDQVHSFVRSPNDSSDSASNTAANTNGEGSPKKLVRPPRLSPTSRLARSIAVLTKVFAYYNALLRTESLAAFEAKYLSVRVAQLALQTCFAVFVSSRTPHVAWTQLVVTAIVLSCWLPALAPVWSRSDSVARRLGCVAAAFALDVVAVMLFPIGLLSLYGASPDAAYNPNVPLSDQRSDTWIVTMLLDFQFLDGRALWPTILSILFGLHIVVCLETTAASAIDALAATRTATSELGRGRKPSTTSKVSPSGLVASSLSTNAYARLSRVFKTLGSQLSVSQLVLFAWGLGVLACHAASLSQSQCRPDGCRVHTLPWFHPTPSCALLELDCAILTTDPSAPQTLTHLLNGLALDMTALQYLTLSNCARLELTSQLRDFDSLVGLKLRRSTIAAWPADATLTSTHHPHLRLLSFVQTNAAPVASPSDAVIGLDASDPLTKLTLLRVCDSTNMIAANASTIALDTRLPHLAFLSVDRVRLSAFPSAVTQLALVELSLRETSIAHVPAVLFDHKHAIGSLQRLWLDRNPLLELSDSESTSTSSSVGAAAPPALTLLSLDSTGLSTLPAWLSTETTVLLGNTSLCAGSYASASTSLHVSCVAAKPLSCDDSMALGSH